MVRVRFPHGALEHVLPGTGGAPAHTGPWSLDRWPGRRRRSRRGGDGARWAQFPGQVCHNVGVKRLRLTLAFLAVAVGVMTVVTFSIVNHSVRSSALAIMQTGRADFTDRPEGRLGPAQQQHRRRDAAPHPQLPADRPAPPESSSGPPSWTRESAVPRDRHQPGRARRLRGDSRVRTGVRSAARRSVDARAGEQRATSASTSATRSRSTSTVTYRVVGIYSTGQALGDTGAMFPLRRVPGRATPAE